MSAPTTHKKCKEQGMDDCARLCIACAAACRKAIAEGQDNPLLFDECEAACKACATECELHPHQHCMDCAEICRQVEVDCRNRMAVKAGI